MVTFSIFLSVTTNTDGGSPVCNTLEFGHCKQNSLSNKKMEICCMASMKTVKENQCILSLLPKGC